MQKDDSELGQLVYTRTSADWLAVMFPSWEDSSIPAARIFGISAIAIRRWIQHDVMPMYARTIAALYCGELSIEQIEDIAEGME